MNWVDKEKIFHMTDIVSYEVATQRMKGGIPITVKRVDTIKGDDKKPNYRSRLVAREIKKLETNSKKELSAMPPLEALKVRVSLLVTEDEELHQEFLQLLDEDQDGELQLALFDISRAHFYGQTERVLYVVLPTELNPMGKFSGRACVKLARTMYRTQDASRIWQDTYIERH